MSPKAGTRGRAQTPQQKQAEAYERRAEFYAAEIADTPVPGALARLLTPGCTVVEMPSGTGHFLPSYAGATARVRLIDASAAMLRHAGHDAARRRLPAPATVCARLEQLQRRRPDLHGRADVVVMPNAALNQLAATIGAAAALQAACFLAGPHGRLLLQTMLWAGPAPDACGIYHPADPHGQWRIDRTLPCEHPIGQPPAGSAQAAPPVVRRRRVQHPASTGAASPVRVEVELRRRTRLLHHQDVTLVPFTRSRLEALLAETGWRLEQLTGGGGRLTEVVATPLGPAQAPPGGPRPGAASGRRRQ